MLDVFRFAWFAVRTFFGVIALVLTLYLALWLFVKVLSAAPGNIDQDSGLGRVKSYNAQAASQERSTRAVAHDRSGACSKSRGADCERP